MAESGDPSAARILKSKPQLTDETIPFYQAYYDVREPVGFDTIVTWRAVQEYVRDIGMHGYGEFMYDVLKKAEQVAQSDIWQTRQNS